MAEKVKKAVKSGTPDEKAAKDAAKATLLAMTKTDAQKAAAVKAPAPIAVKTTSTAAVKVEEKPIMVAPKAPTSAPKPEAAKIEPVKPAAKSEAANAETPTSKSVTKPEVKKTEPVKAAVSEEAPKAESKKEADPSKEFVDGIMTEMALKGGSKKRLVKMLAEQFNFDKQKVMFRLKRALITERYAAAHAEAGH